MIDPVELHIYGFFQKHQADALWIVGVSGGADSIALLNAMNDANLNIIAVHCNFGLRGEESDRDEHFVRSFCEEQDIRLMITRFDTESYRNEKGLSLETACRELRYDYFRRLMETEGAKGIVVAHNKNDNAETVLMNLLRGTGIKGLRGMLPEANDVYRPLLNVSREDIETYLKRKNIDWITDSSNLSNDFTRNKIRNVVMPFLRQLFSDTDKGIETTRRNIEEAEEFIEQKIDETAESFVSEDWDTVNVAKLIEATACSWFVLYQLLSEKGLSKSQIMNIYNVALTDSTESKIFETKGKKFILHKGVLRIYEERNEDIDPMGMFRIQIFDSEVYSESSEIEKHIPLRNKTILLDGDKIDAGRLGARYWQNGDSIIPFGMKGRKKISDIFTDNKVPLDRKHTIPLLTYGEDILWVAGLRRTNLYPVTKDTRRIIKVEYIG